MKKGHYPYLLIFVLGAVVALLACNNGQEPSPSGTHVEAGSTPAEPPRDAAPAAQEAAPDEPEVIEDLSWDDPRAMALEILNRCKGTDRARLISVATTVNRSDQFELRPGQSVCETIFGADSWRSHAVSTWSGQIEAVRVARELAYALFHELEGGEVVVIRMRQEDGRWRFDDIISLTSRAHFDRWGGPVQDE